MRLFKRKKKEKPNEIRVSTSDKVAGKIAGAGLTIQRKFSENMNKLFAKLSPGSVKIFLVVFCLSAGGYSIYLLSNSLFNNNHSSSTIKIDPVKAPKHFDKTGDELLHSDQYVDEETYRNIIAFKMYMDSLKINKTKVFDSIMLARPGLMDSVLMLESIYNSQQLK